MASSSSPPPSPIEHRWKRTGTATDFDPARIRSLVEGAKKKGLIVPEISPPSTFTSNQELRPVMLSDMLEMDYNIINRVLGVALNRTLSPLRIRRTVRRRLDSLSEAERSQLPPSVVEMIEGLEMVVGGGLGEVAVQPVSVKTQYTGDYSVLVTSENPEAFPQLVLLLERSAGWSSFREQLVSYHIVEASLVLQGSIVQATREYDDRRRKPPGTSLKSLLEAIQRFPASLPSRTADFL